MAEHWTTKQPLANPFPAGRRFIHNTTRKDVNNMPAVADPADATVSQNHQPLDQTLAQNGVSVGQAPDVFFKAVTVSPEARRIARILGMRSAENLAQRLIDAEDGLEEAKKILSGAAASIETLVARVHELEKKSAASKRSSA